MHFYRVPVRRRQQEHSELPAFHILLMREALIACDQKIEKLALGGRQQFAITDADPTQICDGENLMPSQKRPQTMRQVLIKQNSHATS